MVNKNSSVPLVSQVQDIICNQIIDGVYDIGDFLNSQEKLASTFNVSRITIRNAFTSLYDLGILGSQKGKGVYVKKIPIVSISGDSVFIDRSDFSKCSYEIFSVESEEVSTISSLFVCSDINCIFSKRTLGDYVMAIEKIWIAATFDTSGLISADLYNDCGELYKKLGVVIRRYEETFEPRFSDEDTAYKMSLPVQTPLLCVKRKSFIVGSSDIFEYREILIRYEDYGKIVVKPKVIIE